MQKMENEEHQRDNKETEHAAFWSDCSTGEPARSLDGCMRKRSFGKVAAVRHGVKKSLAPVEAAMQSDREPKISGASQSEAEKHGDHYYAGGANQPFPRIP